MPLLSHKCQKTQWLKCLIDDQCSYLNYKIHLFVPAEDLMPKTTVTFSRDVAKTADPSMLGPY